MVLRNRFFNCDIGNKMLYFKKSFSFRDSHRNNNNYLLKNNEVLGEEQGKQNIKQDRRIAGNC